MDYVIIDVVLTRDMDLVLVVKKDRPEWQRGRVNLIGGKINDGEKVIEAARRELEEETGYSAVLLTEYGKIIDGDATIYCVQALVDDCSHNPEPRAGETEMPYHTPLNWCMSDKRLIPNLRVVIPMMRAEAKGFEIYDGYRSKSGSGKHQIEVSVPDLEF